VNWIYRWGGDINTANRQLRLLDKKTRKTKQQITLWSNLADKIYLNWIEVSHVPFGISVSLLITNIRQFASTWTLL
jgi:hypothetical protein